MLQPAKLAQADDSPANTSEQQASAEGPVASSNKDLHQQPEWLVALHAKKAVITPVSPKLAYPVSTGKFSAVWQHIALMLLCIEMPHCGSALTVFLAQATAAQTFPEQQSMPELICYQITQIIVISGCLFIKICTAEGMPIANYPDCVKVFLPLVFKSVSAGITSQMAPNLEQTTCYTLVTLSCSMHSSLCAS